MADQKIERERSGAELFEQWIETGYKPLWHRAYGLGEEARRAGLPRECNLSDRDFVTPSGSVLKVYKSAWEQGWDGYKIPGIFAQMESALNEMPTRPMRDSDF